MALVEKYSSAAGAGDHDGSSEANAFSFVEAVADYAAGNGAGVRYNHKGDLALSASLNFGATGATVGSPCIFRGYKTTIGDGYLGRNNQGRLITTNMPSITVGSNYTMTFTWSAYHTSFENFNFPWTTTGSLLTLPRYFVLLHCVFSGTLSVVAQPIVINSDSQVIDCDFFRSYNSATHGIECIRDLNSGRIEGCRFEIANAGSGISIAIPKTGGVIDKCVFILDGKAYGILVVNNPPSVDQCSFYNSGTSIATSNNSQSTARRTYKNNVFSTCNYAVYNQYGATEAHPISLSNCVYHSVANTNYGLGDSPEYGRIDAAADPFVDAANGDLRLKRTSEAVNAATNGGDIGAIQRPAYWPVAADLRKDITVDGITGILEAATAQDVWEYATRILTANTNLNIPSEPPTAEEIRTELDDNSTKLSSIVTDTNEIQTDLTNDGRLDIILDSILTDTGTTLEDKITKIKAAVYDSATLDETGLVVTLSNGTTLTKTPEGRTTVEI